MNVSSITDKIKSFASAVYSRLPLQPALAVIRQIASRISSPEFWTKRTVILAAAGTALLLYGAVKVTRVALKQWNNRGAPQDEPAPQHQNNAPEDHPQAQPQPEDNPPEQALEADQQQEDNPQPEIAVCDETSPAPALPIDNALEEIAPPPSLETTSETSSEVAHSESSSRSNSPTDGSSPLKSSDDDETETDVDRPRSPSETPNVQEVLHQLSKSFPILLKKWLEECEKFPVGQATEEQLKTLEEIRSHAKDLTDQFLDVCNKLEKEEVKQKISPLADQFFASLAEIKEKLIAERKKILTGDSTSVGFLTNPDHEWKQKRYKVALNAFRRSFKNESTKSIDELVEHIEKGQDSSALKESLVQFLKALNRSVEDGDFRKKYYADLSQLRELCRNSLGKETENLHAQETETARIIHQLAYVRYAKVEIYDFMKDIVNLWVDDTENLSPALSREHFESIAKADPRLGAMRIAVLIGNLRGALGCGFDPNMQSNVPFVLADLPLGKTVRFLRMGCPTVQGFFWGTDVVPEFKAYLAHLRANGKKHLYVSLQSGVPSMVCDESARTNAIINLEGEFQDTFACAVLDQDLDFYKQSKSGDVAYTVFKGEFESVLFGELKKTGFYFPAKWKKDPKFNLRLLSLIDDVHRLIFAGKDSLDQHERQDLIEIYYAFLVPYLAYYGNVDIVNCTCKDAIDRAMKTNGLILTLTQIMLKKRKDEDKAGDTALDEQIKNLTLYPSISVKKQPIIHSRRERLIVALKRLRNSEVQKRIVEYASGNGGIGIDRTGTISVP